MTPTIFTGTLVFVFALFAMLAAAAIGIMRLQGKWDTWLSADDTFLGSTFFLRAADRGFVISFSIYTIALVVCLIYINFGIPMH